MALNLGSEPVEIAGQRGVVVLATRRGREGDTVVGGLRLAPAEAVVVMSAA